VILSKRERYAGIVATVAISVLALDYYALEPLLETRNELRQTIQAKRLEQDQAELLIRKKPKLLANWNSKVDTGRGGLSSHESTAGLQLQKAVQEWAQSSGMNLASIKPERTESDKQFKRVVYRATGKGNLASLSRFVWSMQTATIPLRITELQVSSQKDGQDDLSLTVVMSTLYLAPESEKDKNPPKAVAREG
jgi:hypothetical protein